MEVKENNNFTADEQKPYFDAQKVNDYVDSLFESFKAKAHRTENRVKTEWIPVVKRWIEDLKDMSSPNIKAQIVKDLSKSELVGLCRLYKVPESNGVAVYKEERNGKTYIYFAYLRDKELLPRDNNMYMVIEAQSVNADVKELFSDSNLIVLV